MKIHLKILLGAVLLQTLLLGAAHSAIAQSSKLPFSSKQDPSTLPATALVLTDKGAIEIRFYRFQAPVTVKNFVYLARQGFYNNTKFHDYVSAFMIQGGDPTGTGKGGPAHTLPPEFSNVEHKKGTFGMARIPDAANPQRRSHGSQFYICLTSAPHLDGTFTAFAQVINGIDIVDKLALEDKIIEIKFPKSWAPVPQDWSPKTADLDSAPQARGPALQDEKSDQPDQ